MVFTTIQEINKLRKEINRLLITEFFNSIREVSRLRNKINSLLSKRMSNIHLNIAIEKFSKLRFSGSEHVFTRTSGAPSLADTIEFQNFLLQFKNQAFLCLAQKEFLKICLISMLSVFNTLNAFSEYK